MPKTLSPATIEQALMQATDQQLASEKGRRDSAARTRFAGGRPKKMTPCPYCKELYGTRDLAAHRPVCPVRLANQADTAIENMQ